MTLTAAWVIALWIAVIVVALSVAGLIGQIRELADRLNQQSGWQPSRVQPVPTTIRISSEEVIEAPYLIVFVSAECSLCHSLLAQLQTEWPSRVVVPTVIAARGDRFDGLQQALLPTNVYFVEDETLSQGFGVTVFPWMVVVGAGSQVILSESANPPSKVVGLLTGGVRSLSTVGSSYEHPPSVDGPDGRRPR